jgi:RNA-directed DNA polymerase
MEWPDWFRPRGYPHFDKPVRSPNGIIQVVESPERVAQHAFLPFIYFEKQIRKYNRDLGCFVKKSRPLSYASHIDSQIFRRYGLILTAFYERIIAVEQISESVLAYRRFDPPKCNIHFANDAFRFIERHGRCVALAFDVKDFFESLDHKQLKRQWKSVMGADELQSDHFAVFKAITRYSWVELTALLGAFGITKTKLASWRGPICTPDEFRTEVRTARRLIKTKTDGKGIPQGSPISCVLSNIYMLPLDICIANLTKQEGGAYFRYSDDILIVCPLEARKHIETALREQMDLLKLAMHDGPGKSSAATFHPGNEDNLDCDRPLQYLGFTFDGKNVRVRSHTFVRFLRRMRKAVRREKYLARRRRQQGGDGRVRKKQLYERYSHLGKRNFISYANKARKTFDRNAIGRQVKVHWPKLHALLQIEE